MIAIIIEKIIIYECVTIGIATILIIISQSADMTYVDTVSTSIKYAIIVTRIIARFDVQIVWK